MEDRAVSSLSFLYRSTYSAALTPLSSMRMARVVFHDRSIDFARTRPDAFFRVAQHMASDTEGGNDQDKQREDRCGKKAGPLLRIKSREDLVSRKTDGDDQRISP